MHLTKIEATWGETVNLGDYNNARPSLTLEAELEIGEDPIQAYTELLQRAKILVQEEADLALERAGFAARYSKDPRYDMLLLYRPGNDSKKIAVIVPSGRRLEPNKTPYHELMAARLPHMRAYIASRTDRFDILDCSDGNLAPAEEAQAAIEAEHARLRAEREAAQEIQRLEYAKRQEELENQRKAARRQTRAKASEKRRAAGLESQEDLEEEAPEEASQEALDEEPEIVSRSGREIAELQANGSASLEYWPEEEDPDLRGLTIHDPNT